MTREAVFQQPLKGMLLANMVARRRGILSEERQNFVARELLLPGLVVRLKREHLDANAIIEAMKKDKKRTGEGLALIMMKDGCKMIKVNDLTPAEVSGAIAEFAPATNC